MRIVPRIRIVPRVRIIPRIRVLPRIAPRFGGRAWRGRREHHPARDHRPIALILLTAGMLVFAALLSKDRSGGPDLAQAGAIEVVDGDTVRVNGVSWRLQGYDCAETYYARCESERARGNAATMRLRQLIAGAKKVDLIAARDIDRYGRQLGRLRVDGKDVGAILIREGLCVPYSGRTIRRDWCGGS